MTEEKGLLAALGDLTRPIIGIENRTAQEAFDIMVDRIKGKFAALTAQDHPAGDDGVGARLAALKSRRAALDAEITLVEKGMQKAAYDASMREQYLCFNEARLREGKRQLTAAEYASGMLGDGEHS